MALLNEADLRKLAKSRMSRSFDSASDALQKNLNVAAGLSVFDIFLSHSYLDKELILGIMEYLEKLGYSVYVDWRQDMQLGRDKVTKEAAVVVRRRIAQSRSLFFATTEAAKDSRWMPWELGFMDGEKGKSAILPVSENAYSGDTYGGQEYLSIYPYITRGNDAARTERIWVNEDASTYVNFNAWLKGEQPRKHD
jgi:hypothetical protein